MIMMLPQLMPESTDTEVFTRYSCVIINEKIKTDGVYRVKYYDNIDDKGLFVVEEKSSEFEEEYEVNIDKGVVLKEKGNKFSWWFNHQTW